MFYLPRICEHCLNPSCVASCPSGAMYKRAEDGIVLVDQDQLPRLADVRHRAARTRRCTSTTAPARRRSARSATRGRGRAADRVQRDLRRPAALRRVCSSTTPTGSPRRRRSPDEHDLYEAQLDLLLDPHDPAVHRRRAARRGSATTGSTPPSARRSTRLAKQLPGRAAAAPGVPHDADGLVRPAAVTGGRPAHRDRARRGGRRATCSAPSTRCASRSSTWRSCSPRATRRRSAGSLRTARGDALLHARREPRPAARRVRSPRPSGMTGGELVEHVPAAGDRQVRGSLRHPHRLTPTGHRPPARGARVLAGRRRTAPG